MMSDLFSIYLKTVGHLNLKLLIFCRHIASFKDCGNFELSPMAVGVI